MHANITTESLLCLPTLQLSLPGASGNATENQDHLDVCIMIFLKFWANCYIIFTYHQELMTSVGSHGSSSLLFMMKVMV